MIYTYKNSAGLFGILKDGVKKLIRVFSPFFLLFILSFAAPVCVRAADDDVLDMARLYSSEFFEMMLLLVDDYSGIELTPESVYEAALRGVAAELDAYSSYMSKDDFDLFIKNLSGNFEGIGIQISVNDDGYPYVIHVIANSPAEEAGLLKSDVIIKINGDDAYGMSTQQAVDAIGMIQKTVELVISRNGEERMFLMDKRTILLEAVEILRIDEIYPESGGATDNIRYVYLSSFDAGSSESFYKAVKKLQAENVSGIILDMRGNSGGYLDQVVAISRMILPEGPIFYEVDSKGNMTAHYSRLDYPPFTHIAVLTDYATASAAELLAAALQDSGIATVIGETTYGKGVIQTSVELTTGGAFKYTYAEYLRRNKEKINQIGVIPDVPVLLPEMLPKIGPAEDGPPDNAALMQDILEFLGYTYDGDITEQIKALQADLGFEPTGELDNDCIDAINALLYDSFINDDIVLKTGFDTLIEKLGY